MYSELKTAMKVFLRKFDPNRHFFIGLGRDPAPITAFLQALGGTELAINFVGSSGKNYFTGLTAEHIKPFVEAQIPKEVLFGDRTIVLYDQTNGGGTIGAYDRGFPDVFEEYLRSIGSTVKVERAAFTATDYSSAGYDQYRENSKQAKATIHQIDLTSLHEVQQFLNPPYEGTVAQHVRHQLNHGFREAILTERPAYKAFRDGLLERMKRDTDLDHFLTEEVRVTTPPTKAEVAALLHERKAALASDRQKIAHKVRELRRSTAYLKKEVEDLVAGLAERAEGHDKGPYLEESGEKLNAWLVQAVERHKKAEGVSEAARREGPNEMTLHFITHVLDKALAENKIRKRDYRRLLGHALGFSTMDEKMRAALGAHYRKSPDMQRELTEEAEYYLSGSKHQPAGTENMSANYKSLMAGIGEAN